jgi:biotin---protein ligase
LETACEIATKLFFFFPAVETNGEPQLFDQLQNHLKKQILNRELYNTDPEQYWEKHLIGLKNLGVLACQAIEFEYNTNLTEGKTGVVVKPDLISSKNIEDTLIESNLKRMSITPSIVPPTGISSDSSPDSPKLMHLKNELLNDSAAATPKTSPRTSPMKIAMQELALEVENIGIKEEMEPAESLESIEPDLLAAPTPPVTRKLDEIKVVAVEDQKVDSVEIESLKIEEKVEDEQPTVAIEAHKSNGVAKLEVKPPSPPTISTTKDHATRPTLQRLPVTMSPKPILSSSSKSSKPPNVLVYSDSIATRDNVIQTLKQVLEKDIYTIYALSQQDVKQKVWIDNTTLLIVCGNVEHDIGQILLEFFLCGGKLFCMCSDLLHIVLPNYKTAEVLKLLEFLSIIIKTKLFSQGT